MDVNFKTLFGDPNLYFHGYGPEDQMSYLPLSREAYAEADALRPPFKNAKNQVYRVPAKEMFETYESLGFRAPGLNYLHQTGQAGGKLLSRALDFAERTLVYREPIHLEQAALLAGFDLDLDNPPPNFGPTLGFSLTMLSKRYSQPQRVIVAGDMPTAMIVGAIQKADPGRPTVLLYRPLRDHLVANLNPDDYKRIELLAEAMGLERSNVLGEAAGKTMLYKSAAIWLEIIKRFQTAEDENGNTRSLATGDLTGDFAAAVQAAGQLIGLTIDDGEAADAAKRANLEAFPDLSAPDDLNDEINGVLDWAASKASDMGLRDEFYSPLVGEGAKIL